MQIKAHAKINLALKITGQKDGYHLLDTVMQEIDLADDIELEPADEIQVVCLNGELPAHNTLRTAARLFFETAGIRGGIKAAIIKKIPVMAGLGGGSSDGTAVLKALNVMYNRPLSERQLAALAARTGADCPFFLSGGTQRARGFGEILTSLESRLQFSCLLVKPAQGVSTKEAFSLADRLKLTEVNIASVLSALAAGDLAAYMKAAGNDLEQAAFHLVPAIAKAGGACRRHGALFWQMSGSGSCIFALFPDEEKLRKAEGALQDEGWTFVMRARTVC